MKTAAVNHPLREEYLERQDTETQETTERSTVPWHTEHVSGADHELVGSTSRRVSNEMQRIVFKKLEPHLTTLPFKLEACQTLNATVYCAQKTAAVNSQTHEQLDL